MRSNNWPCKALLTAIKFVENKNCKNGLQMAGLFRILPHGTRIGMTNIDFYMNTRSRPESHVFCRKIARIWPSEYYSHTIGELKALLILWRNRVN